MADITLVVAGRELPRFSSVAFNRSLDSLCGEFNFTMGKTELTPWVTAGDRMQMYYKGNLVYTGYIGKRSRKITPAGVSITFQGMEITEDLVDCAAFYKNGSWNGETKIIDILNAITEPYGIFVDVLTDAAGSETVRGFSIDDGETVFDVVDRICRKFSLLPTTSKEGWLQLAEVGSNFTPHVLRYGEGVSNILEHLDEIDLKGRYSDYQVKTQLDSGESIDWFSNTQKKYTWTNYATGSATDPLMVYGLNRFRKIILHPSYVANNTQAQRAAEWEAKIRASRSASINVKVRNWADSDGQLWVPNTKIQYAAPDLAINDEFLISSVSLISDEKQGTIAGLRLSTSESYAPAPLKTKKPRSSKKTYINWFSNDQKPYDVIVEAN